MNIFTTNNKLETAQTALDHVYFKTLFNNENMYRVVKKIYYQSLQCFKTVSNLRKKGNNIQQFDMKL